MNNFFVVAYAKENYYYCTDYYVAALCANCVLTVCSLCAHCANGMSPARIRTQIPIQVNVHEFRKLEMNKTF